MTTKLYAISETNLQPCFDQQTEDSLYQAIDKAEFEFDMGHTWHGLNTLLNESLVAQKGYFDSVINGLLPLVPTAAERAQMAAQNNELNGLIQSLDGQEAPLDEEQLSSLLAAMGTDEAADFEEDEDMLPGMYIPEEHLENMAELLAQSDAEQIAASYSPEFFAQMEVFPFKWQDEHKALLIDKLKELKTFYAKAAEEKLTVVSFIVPQVDQLDNLVIS